MGVSVGIDLGTTFSAVAFINPATQKPEIVLNSEGDKITSSIIQFMKDENTGEIIKIIGNEAKEAFDYGESGCVSTFKRLMGTGKEYFKFDGKSYTSVDLSAILLKYLKEEAEKKLGKIDDAVITVPAYFYSDEREATIKAAEIAGIKVSKIIDEPNAAAMAFGLNHWRENAIIMVYDLGGGTFDVTLTKMADDGILYSLATRGIHTLGGKDWDKAIENFAKTKIYEDTGFDVESDIDFLKQLRGMVEEIKKNLTEFNNVEKKFNVPSYGKYCLNISRDEFNSLTSNLLNKTGVLCQHVLEEAGITWSDVTDILLVGGSTRMKQVPEYLERISGHKPLTQINPDEAVALGAAIQAEQLKSKEQVVYHTLKTKLDKKGKLVTDREEYGVLKAVKVEAEKQINDIGLLRIRETTAHALGIVAINDEGNNYYNEVIIPSNHERPVKHAKKFRFYTSTDSNNELEIYVLQGDDYNPSNCRINSKYVVSGIKHIHKGEIIGTVIRIQYSYDENGIIHIQARQDNSDVDLPIRKEAVTEDSSIFGNPVSTDKKKYDFAIFQSSNNVVHKYRAITFSNVEWEKYDNITNHPSGAEFNEPKVHIKASEKNIEFHGYNISAMDEGVTYTISATDDFEIECDIDTSKIKPHPGGNLIISLGVISASLNEKGGDILLRGRNIASVGSKFNLNMSLKDSGNYTVKIDGKTVGSIVSNETGSVDVVFGFVHDSHYCSSLSHAYVKDIKMMQRSGAENDDPVTPIW